MRQIILDTETTGLDFNYGHRVIEIGCVEMVNRRLTRNHFHRYINPHMEVDSEALEVHGITNEFLADKPDFEDIAEEFIDFVKGAELIIHNAPFDVGFLNHELKLSRLPLGKIEDHCGVFDTLPFAREKHPGQRNSLDALCKRYHVDNSNRQLHGALLDAEILALVYLAMTGGQSALFDDEYESFEKEGALNAKDDEAINVMMSQKTKVILATEEEQKAHQAFLEKIQKASDGKCQWLEEA